MVQAQDVPPNHFSLHLSASLSDCLSNFLPDFLSTPQVLITQPAAVFVDLALVGRPYTKVIRRTFQQGAQIMPGLVVFEEVMLDDISIGTDFSQVRSVQGQAAGTWFVDPRSEPPDGIWVRRGNIAERELALTCSQQSGYQTEGKLSQIVDPALVSVWQS